MNSQAFDESLIIAKKIVTFFESKLIGSVLLLDIGLEKSLINDIDIAISERNLFKIKEYLQDNGYIETRASYKQAGYADTIGNLRFEKPLYIPIHLSLIDKNFKLYSTYEIIAKKFERKNKSDVKQLTYLLTK